MSSEVYYFSGTGNSLHVAKELQKRIPQTDLIPITGLLNKEVIKTNGRTVGYCIPDSSCYGSCPCNGISK